MAYTPITVELSDEQAEVIRKAAAERVDNLVAGLKAQLAQHVIDRDLATQAWVQSAELIGKYRAAIMLADKMAELLEAVADAFDLWLLAIGEEPEADRGLLVQYRDARARVPANGGPL